MILKILIYTLVITVISSKIKADSSTDEPISTKYEQQEEPVASPPKDKLWKRILREFGLFPKGEGEPEDDPLETDPKFLVWKILLKLFILTILYTSYRRLPDDYKPMCYSYGIYLVVTLIMWLYKCSEAFFESKASE